MTAALQLNGVTKRFISRHGEALDVLDEVDLEVMPGECVAILGPSGSGKSTLLRLIAGLDQFGPGDSGEIRIGGLALADARAQIGFVFQTYSSFPWLTTKQNVAQALKRAGSPIRELDEAAMAQLTAVQLGEFANAYPATLSGGQRQRLAIACALALDPALLLLDEPLGALDALTRERLQCELLRLWAETRPATCLVTHDIDEALILGHRIIVLSKRPARIVLSLDARQKKPWLDASGFSASDAQMMVRRFRTEPHFLTQADQLRAALM